MSSSSLNTKYLFTRSATSFIQLILYFQDSRGFTHERKASKIQSLIIFSKVYDSNIFLKSFIVFFITNSISLFSVFMYFFQSLSTISQFSKYSFVLTISFQCQFLINVYHQILTS